MKRFYLLALFLYFCPLMAYSQTAELSGVVQDPSGALIPKASVELRNQDTGIRLRASTNNEGQYSIVGLNPGKYDATVRVIGFMTLSRENILFQVGDKAQINFEMKLGRSDVTVTVNGAGQTINTTDASVGTVIDRAFVAEIPLNGRSFQALILLSPGVVTSTPQGNDNSGEFSVNGQRTASNNFSLDGTTAMNAAASGGSGVGSTGSASSSTALGTTQAIVSIDALQEFRISTSTYSAEFGRQPGAQVSFTSRSGTNEYHGTAFDYLRNYAFDANNWFNNYSTTPLPRPQERQNDFGGVVGGPLTIPMLFSGKDRAFFFFSYEGLRLDQPSPSSIFYVPSNGTYVDSNAPYTNQLYKNLRANAPAVIQPALNGYPLPNCTTALNPQCVDYGNGLSPFIISTATPSSIDSLSARFDFQLLSWLHMFARYSDTQSNSLSLYYGSSMINSVTRNRIYLLGADSVLRGSLTNQLRLQYSPSYSNTQTTDQSVDGSQPVGGSGQTLWSMQGLPRGGKTAFELYYGPETGTAVPHLFALSYGSRNYQPNAVDTFSWTFGHHVFKAGGDYRQTTAYLGKGTLSAGPLLYYTYTSADEVLANSTNSIQSSNLLRQDPITKNLGLFVQDEWHVLPRISFSLGLRWDLNPPPTISGAQQYTYTGDINNPSTLALSTLGAPLYKTTYTDFAPRVGAAITIYNQPAHETVLRVGGGLFYDTGNSSFIGTVANGNSLGSTNFQEFGTVYGAAQGFPLPASTILSPVNTHPLPGTTGYTLEYILAPNFVPPSTIQWNATLEQALGTMQSVTVSYVGSEGRNLSVYKEYSLGSLTKNVINCPSCAPTSLFSAITEYENGPGSNYNSLQLQYKRQMSHGLQVLGSFTWAHAIDSASTDYSANGILPPKRGNSDHDIRENFTTALVYMLPTQYSNRLEKQIFAYWNADMSLTARTAFPYDPLGSTVTDPITGNEYPSRINWNGLNPYVYTKGIPGGRQVNPAVFSAAAAGDLGTAPRNFLRGFPETEVNVALQRTFPIREWARLQFRAEAFNVANHPNFGKIYLGCGATVAGQACNNPLMGQATATLSNSLGGLSSIYQQGGPRSLQFALKLQF
jgi:hypothetical protein